MKYIKKVMGMTAVIDISDEEAKAEDAEKVFSYFSYIDDKFSTYKKDSEIERINRKEIGENDFSHDMKKILSLADKTKKETDGYFDIKRNGRIDPSGIVKGFAIHEGVKMLRKLGYKNFYVEIGGDIEVAGKNPRGEKWRVGIQNPFNKTEIIKVVHLSDRGIATSGSYVRGEHIYDPIAQENENRIAGITVVGPNIYEADRFATAAYAMGEKGLEFIERLSGFEAYMVKNNKRAMMTSGFSKYLIN